MIGHEAVPVTEPSVLLNGLIQDLQEPCVVFLITIDRLFIVSPGGDVVYRAWKLGAKRSCHFDVPFLSD